MIHSHTKIPVSWRELMCIMDGNLVNGLTFMSSFTNTHKDGVGAMVYAPNVGGTQINLYLATYLFRPFHGQRGKQSPIIYHLISSSDLPYPVPLLGWYINHTSTQGPPEPISNQKYQ